jgi:triacylglycerol lipase
VSEPVVVILHGLARTQRSMHKLERALISAGFKTWSGTYPSRAKDISTLAALTAERIKAEAPSERYHAVTHSLGGILVRHMRDVLPWSRLVMLAPPNQGSRIAAAFAAHPLYRWFYGPAGQGVISPEAWPSPPRPFAVIAGTKSLSLGNPTSWITKSASMFPPNSPSDGTVSVDETKHPEMAAFAEVDATHTFIMNHPRARALTVAFLKSGSFDQQKA